MDLLAKNIIVFHEPAECRFYQRVARIYASTPFEGEQVPTVYLIKPDKIRYWTRSMALRDADEVSADIMSKPSYSNTHLKTLTIA